MASNPFFSFFSTLSRSSLWPPAGALCSPSLFLSSSHLSFDSSPPHFNLRIKQPAAKKKEEPKPAAEAEAAGAGAGASGEPSAAAAAAEPAAAAAAAPAPAAAEGGPAAPAAAATGDAYTNTASQLMTGEALEQSITMVSSGWKKRREFFFF